MAKTLKVLVGVLVGFLILATIVGVGIKTAAVEKLGLDSFGEALLKYAFVGDDEVFQTATSGVQSLGYLISALMVWLIIFVAFGDIFENFGAFSSGVGWIIAFAIGVIAANIKLINAGVILITGWFVWAGTAAVYLGLGAAIFFFLLVSLGITPALGWIRNRNAMIKATTGKEVAREGLRTLGAIGRESRDEGERAS